MNRISCEFVFWKSAGGRAEEYFLADEFLETVEDGWPVKYDGIVFQGVGGRRSAGEKRRACPPWPLWKTECG